MINFLRRTPLYPVLAGIYPRLHNFYIWLVWQICYLLPVDQHKIVFSNFNGGGFGDNARYIAEEFLISCTGSAVILHFLSQRS